jgi:hypothetical protein
MKIFLLIVLFFGFVIGLSMIYFQYIDTSFRDSATGLFFFYPPALQISGNHDGFDGENSTVVLRPSTKVNVGQKTTVNSEHPLISVSVYYKKDDSELEQWLTLSRSDIWSMAKDISRAKINGRNALWFSVKTSPYPAKIAYIDFGDVVVLVAAEYRTLASETLIAWERIVNSVDITKH